MKKLNILRIVYDFADSNVQAEGLSTGPYELTIAQGNLGHKIYVLTGNLNGNNLVRLKFKYSLSNGNVIVYNLPRALWKFGPFLTSSLCVLPFYFYLRFTKKIDLVHNHQQMGVWFLLYKLLFGSLDKIPVIHTNHGVLIVRRDKALKRGEKLGFWTKYFEYPIHMFSDFLASKVADSLVAVSKGAYEEIKERYNVKNPLYLVENGVNTEKFRRQGKKTDFKLPKDAIILGNGGRLTKRKNIDFVVRSLELLPKRYKLVLWGRWENGFEKVINNLIKEYSLSERVKYLGVQPYWNVDKYFRSLDIFVLPSSHEGLPKVAVEALASGCKLVASGFEFEYKIPNAYIFNNPSVERTAEYIKKASEEEDDYNGAREVLEKNYSWKSKSLELNEIYETVLN